MPNRRRSFSVTVSTVLALSACGGSDETSTGDPGHLTVDVPVEQQPYFEDGTVSLDEYQAAFEEFRSCAVELGNDVVENGRDPASGVIAYSTAEELLDPSSGASNETTACYQRFFMATEIEFQLTDAAAIDASASRQLQEFQQLNAPCLADHGVSIPPDLEPGSQAFQELLAEFDRLALAGECEGVTAVPVP